MPSVAENVFSYHPMTLRNMPVLAKDLGDSWDCLAK